MACSPRRAAGRRAWRRVRLVVSLLALGAAAPARAQDAPPAAGAARDRVAFPLRVARSGRYFEDQRGRPFLYHADTGWQLFARLTAAEAREYLAYRKRQGFTTVQLQLSFNPDSADRAGHRPFAGAGPGDADFARPDSAYHAHVAEVLGVADSLGLLVVLSQPWLGCCREAYGGGPDKPIRRNGPAKTRGYGEYLGRRFARFTNLFWIVGGDNDPGAERAELAAFAEGLRAAAPAHQLLTYHAATTHSSTDVFPDAGWLGFSFVYTYWRGKPGTWVPPAQMPHVYEAALREYDKGHRMPLVLGESQYEGAAGNDAGTPRQVRRQAYWALLSGAAGHAYGSELWAFPPNWRAVMRSPGAEQMRHVAALFGRLPWWRLVPDRRHRVVIAGSGAYGRDDYVTAAVTDDRTLLVAYLAERRTVAVDLTKLAGPAAAARWFDPRTGETRPAGRYAAPGVQRLTPPSDDDWVLLVEAGRPE
jgi:hypothetical protein